MSNMFSSYDNNIKYQPCGSPAESECVKDSKLITNIKGEILGIQINQTSPLQLYFHLENVCEVGLNEIIQGITLFEILTTTHKSVISREYPTFEILNQDTNDLCISIPQIEMINLKKETYNMRVTLKTTAANYVVFADKDGYLIIR